MLGRDSISAVVESLFAIENLGVRGYCKPFYSCDTVASIQHNNCSAFEKQQNNDVGWPWKFEIAQRRYWSSIPKCYFCSKWKGTLVVQASKNKRSREAPKKFVESLFNFLMASLLKSVWKSDCFWKRRKRYRQCYTTTQHYL